MSGAPTWLSLGGDLVRVDQIDAVEFETGDCTGLGPAVSLVMRNGATLRFVSDGIDEFESWRTAVESALLGSGNNGTLCSDIARGRPHEQRTQRMVGVRARYALRRDVPWSAGEGTDGDA